jgi:hypothetical protein
MRLLDNPALAGCTDADQADLTVGATPASPAFSH